MDVHARHEMRFTRNWFSQRNLPTFVEMVVPSWQGKPCVYLELGVFEGMSMCWMLANVLTHPDSYGVGVDTWLQSTKLDERTFEEVRERAYHNTSPWRYPRESGGKCELVRGCSAEILRKMQGRGGFAGIKTDSVDLCMIDANHWDLAVLDDARQAAKLVKIGGHLLFDDVENRIEKKDHVKQGLAAFLAESNGSVRFLWKHRFMECYERVL